MHLCKQTRSSAAITEKSCCEVGPSERGHERPETQHDDQHRGGFERTVHLQPGPVRRVHVDGERGGVQPAGGGGAVGGGVHGAVLPGDAGGGGAVGVVHPIQRSPSAAGQRPRDEQQSEPKRQRVHPGYPETRHVTLPGSAPSSVTSSTRCLTYFQPDVLPKF